MVGEHELGCGQAGLVVDNKPFGQATEPGPVVGFHGGTVCIGMEARVVFLMTLVKTGTGNVTKIGEGVLIK